MTWLDDRVDWHPGEMPANVEIGDGALLETTYSLGGYRSELECGLRLGDHSAIWNPTMLYTGPAGMIDIGAVTCINQAIIEANLLVSIGSYVFIAWGAVISDSLLASAVPVEGRRSAVTAAAARPDRVLESPVAARPVRIDDDAWIGFDAVIGPGVTIGRGAVVGAKSWVVDDVPEFAIVAGTPARRIGTAT